jgi:hypothetical protein
MSFLSPYGAVLRAPHACGAFVSSLAGRLCYGIVFLSLLLTLTDGRHDYGFAGLVMALFGAAIVLVSPLRAWLVSAGLVVAGTGLFVRSPALRRWPSPVAGPASDAADATSDRAGAGRAILQLALATGAIGLCLGGIGLVIVAFSQARHDPAAVAWIEAVLSVGSALGGLGYGAVTWRISARQRLALLATGLAIMLALAALSPNLPVLALLIGLAGLLVSPALATAYVLTDSLASPTARNRAGNWVNSGYNAGNSAGAVLTGQLIGRIPLSACLPVLAAPALLAVVPLLSGEQSA